MKTDICAVCNFRSRSNAHWYGTGPRPPPAWVVSAGGKTSPIRDSIDLRAGCGEARILPILPLNFSTGAVR